MLLFGGVTGDGIGGGVEEEARHEGLGERRRQRLREVKVGRRRWADGGEEAVGEYVGETVIGGCGAVGGNWGTTTRCYHVGKEFMVALRRRRRRDTRVRGREGGGDCRRWRWGGGGQMGRGGGRRMRWGGGDKGMWHSWGKLEDCDQTLLRGEEISGSVEEEEAWREGLGERRRRRLREVEWLREAEDAGEEKRRSVAHASVRPFLRGAEELPTCEFGRLIFDRTAEKRVERMDGRPPTHILKK